MSTINIIVFSLTVILLFGVKSYNATVLCTSCPMGIRINLSTDTDLNMQLCTFSTGPMCELLLHIDYTDSNDSFALLDASQDVILLLTNSEPQIHERTYIWFNEVHVQRIATILCFSGASCGVDLINNMYKTDYRSFNYTPIQNVLAKQLYSSSPPNSTLTCAAVSGASISCPTGFCRTTFDGNGLVAYSNCVHKELAPTPYGLIVSKTTLSDLDEELSTITFTCNKLMCNSKENTQMVLQQLITAGIIPQPIPITTVISSTTTETSHITTPTTPTTPTTTKEDTTTTTPISMGINMLNNEQKLLVPFLLLLSTLKAFN